MPQAPARQAARRERDDRRAAAARSGGHAAIAGVTLRCLRPGQRAGDSQSLVRYKTNDYSVPVAYGHQDVWVRGYVDEVVIGCRGEIIARHPRCWAREDVVFDPVHYLPLIEQKINALDQAAPLAGLGPARRVRDAAPPDGRRAWPSMAGANMCRFCACWKASTLADLHAAVKQALQLGAIGFDAVKHLVLCRVERGRPGWTWTSIPTCHGPRSRRPRPSLHAPAVV
jgi:hypothetical protein